jgi:signal transduction histidine kinase
MSSSGKASDQGARLWFATGVPVGAVARHDFRHVRSSSIAAKLVLMTPPKRASWLFMAFGASLWAAVGLPHGIRMALSASRPHLGAPAPVWLLPFAAYGAAFLWLCLDPHLSRRLRLLLVGAQSAAVVAMAAIYDSNVTGVLLTPVAVQAAGLVGTRRALAWVAAQSGLLRLALWPTLSDPQCWLVFALEAAFQIVAVGVVHGVRREAEAGEALRRMNAELSAAQAMLVESSATAERLRISRELHDAWGHDLTALSLQLEYAVNVTAGTGRSSVLEARDLARLLLAKVRDVVGGLRLEPGQDLRATLEVLALSAPQLAVHLDLPNAPSAQPHGETAQAVVRSAQEIITNTLRHAGAANLWLVLRIDPDGVRLEGRDDGQGVDRLRLGHGLTGLRERFEALGGTVAFESRRGAGFRVAGWLPPERSAP